MNVEQLTDEQLARARAENDRRKAVARSVRQETRSV